MTQRITLIRWKGILIGCLNLSIAPVSFVHLYRAAKAPSLLVAVIFWIIAAIVVCAFAVTGLIQRRKKRK